MKDLLVRMVGKGFAVALDSTQELFGDPLGSFWSEALGCFNQMCPKLRYTNSKKGVEEKDAKELTLQLVIKGCFPNNRKES